jgi:PAS domain S-box-containing protein
LDEIDIVGIQKTGTNINLCDPERQYRDLYDNAPIAYFTVNAASGHILNCNKAAQRLLGYSRKVMLQMKVFELYADTLHGLHEAQKVFKDFKAGKSIRNIELQVKQHSGHLIWVSLSVEPEMDPSDKTVRSRSMMVDISDRKEAEIALHKMHNNVQNLVTKRTAQLAEVNAQLKQEIKQRRKAERSLRETAKTLLTLINATTNLVMLLDADGTLVTANNQTCERYGKTLQEFKGLNIFSLMPPKLAKSRKKLADEVIRSKQPVCCFEEIEDMFYNSIIYPILDDKGIVRQYSVFVQDVTPLKLAEKELKKSESRYRMLVEKMNDGLGVKDENGVFTYVNDRLCAMLGYSREEFVGHPAIEFLDEANRKNFKEQMAARRRGSQNAYELAWRHKNNSKVSTIISPQPLLDEAGNFQGAIAIITDNTSQKQTEAELIREQLKLEHRVKERTKELVETNQALSVLARNIDQKRERVQEKTTRAVNSKIFPIIEQFQKNKAFAKHRTEIDVLKAYLKDLTAEAKDEPNIIFILSNAELRVATMIKNGFSSPEIARMLSVSQDTVKTHRKNIRRKLNICNTKINLTTYLRAKLG